MPFVLPKHVKSAPAIGMRVAHILDGAGTVTAVITKGKKQLCIVQHDDGTKRGHYWDALTDHNVPPRGRSGPGPSTSPAVA